MAKNKEKNNQGKKKLSDLKRKDLVNRKKNKQKQIDQLLEQQKSAATQEERDALQQQIKQAQKRKGKINKAIDKKDYGPPKGQSLEEKMNKLYSSDKFLMLSPEQQQLIRTAVDTFQVDPANLKLSKKQRNLAYKDALNAATKQFTGDKKKLDMDYEESLRADIGDLERLIEQERANLIANEETGNTYEAEQRKMTIRNLQDALGEASSRYEVESNRKNEYLQKELENIKYRLETETGRADEDKVMELRQLQRKKTQQLRDTQNNMAQRGLAFSGIRAQAEDELESEFEDYMTSAELDATRRIADAERIAKENEQNLRTLTQQEQEDLLYNYGVTQRNVIQGAESVVGTGDVQSVLSGKNYAIGGVDPNSYLYGDISGSLSEAEKARIRAYQNSINQGASTFERLYGTDELKKKFGENIGAMDSYTGYKPTTGLSGTTKTQYQRDIEEAQRARKYAVKQGTKLNKSKYLAGKI